MSTETVLLIISIGLLAVIVWLLIKNASKQNLDSLVDTVFGKSSTKVLAQSHQQLSAERKLVVDQLAAQQSQFEKTVQRLEHELKARQTDLRQIEKDREAKFSQLTSALSQQRELTNDLHVTVRKLQQVLQNNQHRGSWGEKVLEDILRSHGLQEGVHFARQQQLGTGRPDITLLLPNERVVPVDVKFPYAALQRYAAAETDQLRERSLKEFEQDVRKQIQKVAGYIQPDQDTLDYALLFVPNEAVFSFINQELPQVIDQAMQQRVILVSPFTFLIVARTITESYRNFMIESNIRSTLRQLDGFRQEWGKFTDQLGKFGHSIESMSSAYQELTGTRFRQLEKKLESVERLEAGEK